MAKKQPTARAGKRLGRYVIEKELGRGGMGVVYLARDENLGRLVALKTTSVAGLGSVEKTRNQRRQRFIREVRALASLSHENVVHVYDAGEEDDPDLGWLLYYSMQYVEGITLAQLVQSQGALEGGAAAAVCSQVALGLGAGHERGIVHRDVKPANIFLSLDGRALIGDFGIAKVQGSTQITRRDQLVGTPNYLAPEQILGEDVTPATDVFALGALFYVVTTNRPLRTKLDAAALLAAARTNEAKDKILAEKALPSGLRKVIARALEREPKKRWKDGAHFADALSDHATRVPKIATRAEEKQPPKRKRTSAEKNAAARQGATGSTIPAPGSDNAMSAVEQAAQALLNEVAETHEPADAGASEPAPLPVARTESTVMFNLRAAEKKEQEKLQKEEAAKRAALKKAEEAASAIPMERVDDDEEEPLPVARTESTVMFNLRKVEEDHKRGGGATADATDPSPPGHEDTLDPDDDGPLVQDTPLPYEDEAQDFAHGADTQLTAVPQPEIKKVVPEQMPRPLPPLDERRMRLLGASTLGGTVLGLIVVFAFSLALGASPRVLPKPVQDPAALKKRAQKGPSVPDFCGAPAASSEARAESKKKLADATELLQRGKRAQARRRLEEALALDGANERAHFERAKLAARKKNTKGAARHYECVVVLAPDSPLAEQAGKAIKVAERQ